MMQDADQPEFGQFVAAVWERQGWQTQVTRDEGRTFVAVQRPETGEEGLLWAVPDGEVGGRDVQQFRSLCDDYGVSEAAIVTGGTVSDHAEKVADGTGVELLDGEGLRAVLEREGLTGLLEQYGRSAGGRTGEAGVGDGSAGDGAGDGGAGGESPFAPVTAVVGRVAGLASGVPVVAVLVVVALLGAGVLFGPSVPFLGSSVPFLDGGDGVSAASTAPENATASLHVAWNAKVTDTIDPNRSDGRAYPAPEGEEFVLVRMTINNTGNASVPLRQSAFKLRANGTTYANATLADHDLFLGFPIGPGERLPIWTVFAVPEGEAGTLVYDQNATETTVAVAFERDSGLAVNETRM